ncbi:ABC-type amino acid transport system, solute-binding protein [Aster yellows witches'-broom phytoplasma AYWB]|uniref:ABC-type amino acid transport system, solute-binding protein n=2 Tax=16SrI (Aster yellows group) TaxID=3042590 RepID=Q2NJL3_AYWBP|nr:transporter substrate-binding domain-containing protein [Aster yellows witches'-broom phytoplasma]ABC65380.1 ABC-type amino acid transport system, solute-binding protein [Aster yellows witches'-broom phytoplasma AYWB]
MKLNKKIIISLVVGVFLILGIIGGILWPKNTKNNVLVIGMELEYSPLEYVIPTKNEKNKDQNHPIYGQSGYACGYNVFIAKKLAEKLGKKLVIKKINFNSLISALNSNDIDLVVAGLNKNPDRDKEIDFSKPYVFGTVKIVLKQGSKVDNLSSLQSEKIGYQSGSTYQKIAEGITTQTQEYSDLGTIKLALQANEIDGFIVESDIADIFLEKNPTLAMEKKTINKELMEKINTDLRDQTQESFQSRIGIKKGNDKLKNKVDEALEQLQFTTDNNTTQELKQKAIEVAINQN